VRSSLSRWANSIVHDTTRPASYAPHRTAPHALARCSCPPPSTSPRPAILPAAVSAKSAPLVRRAPDLSGAEPQREHKQPSTIRTRLHCETVAPSTPPTRTRLESPPRSVPACRAPRRARASAAPPRPLRSHRIVYCTHNRQHTPLAAAAAAAAAALAVRHHSRPGTAGSLAAERL
jgi:hypothetical protein